MLPMSRGTPSSMTAATAAAISSRLTMPSCSSRFASAWNRAACSRRSVMALSWSNADRSIGMDSGHGCAEADVQDVVMPAFTL